MLTVQSAYGYDCLHRKGSESGAIIDEKGDVLLWFS
jgi:hypothetical protein